jgi:predicted acylesterase/phospholipase RssA
MRRIGFALSGGGFRATLYHLGLVRFLRDAGILPSVTHITAVSGGSILAAHLVLNWDRYNGSPEEFDSAASDLLAFIRMDVRNRIVRRFGLAFPVHLFRWLLLQRPMRMLTRTGLLEYHYQKYLYGDTSLFQLPEHPQLHLLATNLSEGRLCSFTRTGLLMQRWQSGRISRFDPVHAGLATVPMAVAASSAFPGFFPPTEFTGADIGANEGKFGRQAFTDGGVFDNLGVRMFRCMERFWDASDQALSRDDFFDFEAVAATLAAARQSGEPTPLHRIAQIVAGATGRSDQPALEVLGSVMAHHPLQRDPHFADLELRDADAEALRQASRAASQPLDVGDQFWLNRRLVEAAYRQATGKACFRRLNSGLDGVLVSDVGKLFQVQSNQRAGGVIRTFLRTTDILMDRVWQLEKETFEDTPGFVFAPVTDVIQPHEDPTAPHPEIQRQAANIRTDLDRFSDLEISSLVRHGYCVGRQACRSRPDLFGSNLPANPPWDPISAERAAQASPESTLKGVDERPLAPIAATVEARTLQASAQRRVWRTLLDYRDWTTYIYVPIIVPILILAPYFTYRAYKRSQQTNQLVESIVQNSRDYQEMSLLLDAGSPSAFTGVAAEDIAQIDEPDDKSFLILQDTQIVDARRLHSSQAWYGGNRPAMYGYRRLRVARQEEGPHRPIFRVQLLPQSSQMDARFPTQQLQPKLRRAREKDSPSEQEQYIWEMAADFRSVPVGEFVDVFVEYASRTAFQTQIERGQALSFAVQTETAEKILWLLMPEGKEYQKWTLARYETGKPDTVEAVKPVTEYLEQNYKILAFKLLALKAGYTYEVRWTYKD